MSTTLGAVQTRYAVPPELWPAPITRTMDARHLNAVVNDPSVRPLVGGGGEADLSGVLQNPAHVGLVTPHGGFVFINLGDGRYEVHTMFLPEGRGPEAFDAMHAAQHYMFSATDGVEGLTKVATTNTAAAAFALRAGFERRFTGDVRWSPTELVPHVFYGLTLERWCLRSAVTQRLGEWFHIALAQAREAGVTTVEAHPDDAVHDHYVGATMLMLRAGNARKAEATYNAWAKFAAYALMRVVTEHPLVVEIDGLVVEIRADAMEILSCP